MPIDDRRNYRRDYLLNRMVVGLGGRAAEEVACEEITGGAQNDLQVVTHIARAMVTQLGMDDQLGPENFGSAGDGVLDGNPYAAWEPKDYSDETARRIDAAVHRMIDAAHRRALALLGEHRASLDAIATALLREESLNLDQIIAVMPAMPVPITEVPGQPQSAPQSIPAVA